MASGVAARKQRSEGDRSTAVAGVELVRLELDDPAWSAFVKSCATATPFHHPSWAQLLADTYGYSAFALALRDGDGAPVAGAPFIEVRALSRRRRWASLPFTDVCPLLAADPMSERAFAASLAQAQASLEAPALEVRAPLAEPGWQTSTCALLHVLELGDAEDVRRRFSRSQVIRNIARAEREGVTVRAAANPADLDAFYALHTRTRRRQGVPVQPRRFFDLLWSRFVEPGHASILLASAGGPPLAGALFLNWNGTTIYKFGASDPQGWPVRPNHLLFWTAIEAACARGDREFDFGRTDLDNSGLSAFKRAWGGVERPLTYSTLAPGAALGHQSAGGRLLGAAIRRGPSWLCRGLGEALYRYAASR